MYIPCSYCHIIFQKQQKPDIIITRMNIDNLDRLLGEGSYHWVYSLKENPHVAVKIAKQSHGQLKREAKVLNALEHSHLFPKISESGTIHLSSPGETQQTREAQYLVMDRMGVSLQDLMTLRKGKVGVSMLRNIGLQLLNKLGHLHTIGVVHNDIKPCNILFGRDVNRNQVYLIDFGLASLPDSMTEPQPCQTVFMGNIPFSPINTLKGNQSQPLDDLCSLSYLLLWMAEEGKCSWQLQTSSPRAQTCNCQCCPSCLQEKLQRQIDNKHNFLQSSISFPQTQKGNIAKHLHRLLRTLYHCQGSTISTYSFAVSGLQTILLNLQS